MLKLFRGTAARLRSLKAGGGACSAELSLVSLTLTADRLFQLSPEVWLHLSNLVS